MTSPPWHRTLPRLRLDISPFEVAVALRHRAGLAFLDSAVVLVGAISIVAADPESVLIGSDFAKLEQEMEKNDGADGAAIGWIDYEGTFHFGIYRHLLVFEHDSGTWWGSEVLAEKIAPSSDLPKSPSLQFSSDCSEADFCAQVVRAQEYIAAGDIYQVNLSHTFRAVWDGDGLALFKALRESSPAPYSAFLASADQEIISSSPELFLQIQQRRIITRPIKGTRPRFADPALDMRSARELLESAKENAELLMITDLERNDFGKICRYGGVRVTDLLKLERYKQIFHLASTVEGELRENVSHVSALAACFPGGSITGAPKKRAMEIISEIERRERGFYTGAIGYFGFSGESQFSIAIRTVLKKGPELQFSVGAGIVADSVPLEEYEETLAKAAGILLAAKRVSTRFSEDERELSAKKVN